MLLDMSALNQNNKRPSRLAIISEHVAADKRKQFGAVWVDFCQFSFSFFSVPVYPFRMWPFCTLCVLLPLGCLLSDVVLIWGCFDANGGCSVGGTRGLMSSKCSGIAERYLLLLTGDEAFVAEQIGWRGLSQLTDFKVCVGACGSWPGPASVF